jgi:hypothetical protein
MLIILVAIVYPTALTFLYFDLLANAPTGVQQGDTDQQNSAVFDHLASATGGVSIFASSSRAHCASRFVLCLVPERAIDWQAGVSFRF